MASVTCICRLVKVGTILKQWLIPFILQSIAIAARNPVVTTANPFLYSELCKFFPISKRTKSMQEENAVSQPRN